MAKPVEGNRISKKFGLEIVVLSLKAIRADHFQLKGGDGRALSFQSWQRKW